MTELSAVRTGATVEGAFDNLIDEVTERLQAGRSVDLEDYCRRFPEFAERLRKLFPTLRAMADIGHSLGGSKTDATETGLAMQALGDFRIVREIGRGGMGVVYEAEHLSLSRRVALKVLPFAAVLDPRQLQRFKNEALAAAQLDHPHIVDVYGVGCERGVHYYAMRYIEGETLADVVRQLQAFEIDGDAESSKRGTPPDPEATQIYGRPTRLLAHPAADRALVETPAAAGSTDRPTKSKVYFRSVAEIGRQVAAGLDHAHQQGIVHRDIKPSNLMLDAQGKAWVTDFGLAHIETSASLTVTGDILGTLRYMSPEQAMAKRIVIDHRTDVYSLGVTLYELLTLKPAFNGEDRRELLRQIAFDEPVAPRRLNRSVPPELETIVLKASAKNPNERYATAQELADDLSRFLNDEPIRAKRPTPLQRARKWARRHQSVVTTAIAVAVVALIGFLGYYLYAAGELGAANSELGERNSELGATNSRLKIEQDRVRLESAQKDAAIKRLKQEQRQAKINLCTLLLTRGQESCNKGDVALGLLWMGRALEAAPEDAADLQRVIRTNLASWQHQIPQLKASFAIGPTATATFRPDGKAIFAVKTTGGIGNQGRAARAWDAANGKPLSKPIPCPLPTVGGIYSNRAYAEFTPDGKTLVTINGNEARLWDVAQGTQIGPSLSHADPVRFVSFSGDGRTVLSVTQKRPKEIRRDRPDGSFSVTTLPGPKLTTLNIWETATGKRIGKPLALPFDLLLAAISPDGKTLLTGIGQRVELWTAAGGGWRGRKLLHPGAVKAAAFSPDGRFVLTTADTRWTYGNAEVAPPGRRFNIQFGANPASRNGTAQLWEVATGRPVGAQLPHAVAPEGILFSPDGHVVLTWDRQHKDGFLWHIGASLGGSTHRFYWMRVPRRLPHSGNLTAAAFSPDGLTLATSGGGVRLWNVATGRMIGAPLSGPPTGKRRAAISGTAVAFSPDGRTLLTAGGELNLWQLPTGPPRLRWSRDSMKETSTDHGEILPGGGLHSNRSEVPPLQRVLPKGGFGTDIKFEALAFGPGSKTVLTAFRVSGSNIRAPEGHRDTIYAQRQDAKTGAFRGGLLTIPDGISAEFSPDGETLVTVAAKWVIEDDVQPGRKTIGKIRKYSRDRVVQFWDTGTWQPIGPPRPYRGEAWGFRFSGDGRIALMSGTGFVQRWDMTARRPAGLPWRNAAYPLALSRDGKLVLVGRGSYGGATYRTSTMPGKAANSFVAQAYLQRRSQGREARLCDAVSGVPLGQPLVHQGEVRCAAFSPDGGTIATGSTDGTVRLWDVARGRLLVSPLDHAMLVDVVVFSPNGRILLTRTSDGVARFWDVATGRLLIPPMRHRTGRSSRFDHQSAVAYSVDGRFVVTGTEEGHLRCWQAPPKPLEGTPKRLALWTQTLGTIDLDANGVIGSQDSLMWNERHARLSDLGGSPASPRENRLTWHRRVAAASVRDWQHHAAVWHLDRLIPAEPGHWKHYANRGHGHRQLRKFDKAVADTNKAIALGGDDVRLWFDRGLAWFGLRQWDKAEVDLTIVIARSRGKKPQMKTQADRSGLTVRKFTAPVSLHADALYYRGLIYEERRDDVRAIEEFSQALALVPGQRDARFRRGLAYFRLKAWQKAADDFTESAKLYTRSWGSRFNRGLCFANLNRHDEAVTDFKQVVRMVPNHTGAFVQIARSSLALQRHADAITAWKDAVRVSPRYSHGHAQLAWLMATCPDRTQRNPKEAVFHANQALKIAPRIRNHWSKLGVAQYSAGQWAEALATLTKAERMAGGRDDRHRFFLAMAQWRTGKKEQARRSFDQAVRWMEASRQLSSNPEQRGFRLEAEALLGIARTKSTSKGLPAAPRGPVVAPKPRRD